MAIGSLEKANKFIDAGPGRKLQGVPCAGPGLMASADDRCHFERTLLFGPVPPRLVSGRLVGRGFGLWSSKPCGEIKFHPRLCERPRVGGS